MLSGIFYSVDINLIGKNRYFILKCELMDLVKGPFTSNMNYCTKINHNDKYYCTNQQMITLSFSI